MFIFTQTKWPVCFVFEAQKENIFIRIEISTYKITNYKQYTHSNKIVNCNNINICVISRKKATVLLVIVILK